MISGSQRISVLDQPAHPASGDGVLLFTLFIAVLGFLAYLFFLRRSFAGKIIGKTEKAAKFSLRQVLFQRGAGVLFLGVLPGAILFFVFNPRLRDYGLAFEFVPSDLIWILGAGIVAFFAGFLVSKFTGSSKIYPQIREKSWGLTLVVINALSWTAYLLAYEFLFRGIVLFSSAVAFGVLPAIALNVFLYALAHWPKGIKEMFGAVPFGIALCLITLETGTIWAALAAHLALALSHDHFSLRSNPEMGYSFFK